MWEVKLKRKTFQLNYLLFFLFFQFFNYVACSREFGTSTGYLNKIRVDNVSISRSVQDMTGANEILCGLGGWRPECLQRLASKKVYMFIYGSLGIIQGMFFSYLSATLATIERQFGIKSKEAAYLMSGNEFSQILFVFVMPMLVKVKKRPLWTALGLWCSAIGCFLMAVPHWSKSPQQVSFTIL